MKTLQSKNILIFTNIRIFFSASDAVSRSVIVMYVRTVGRFENLEGGGDVLYLMQDIFSSISSIIWKIKTQHSFTN